MEGRKQVLKETGLLLAGNALCTGIMIGIFVLLKKHDTTVLLGGIIGCLLSTLNYFFLAVAATVATERAQKQDVEGAKKLLKLSQMLRYISLMVLLIVFAKSGFCNVVALAVPLLFQQPILLLYEFFRKKGD